MSSIYDFTLKDFRGREVPLSNYKDRVLLIVNTATECGFAYQYEELDNMDKAFRDKGLDILDIPSNQFDQSPEDGEDIADFCIECFDIQFKLFETVDVNGPSECPLYTWLKQQDVPDNKQDIRWNYEKFLVDRKGNVVARYNSDVEPEDIVPDIEKLLAS